MATSHSHTCLHEHLGKNQFHGLYHADNPNHPSIMELEQGCPGHDLKANECMYTNKSQTYKYRNKGSHSKGNAQIFK